ncbi:MAG TPA: aminoacyl-tRNA hydrolase [Candidatus Moranbacteria bacterium]|nr:aminoacyl-tRNA hydrolase [Candidatus Moranbacteria bacterium]HRZ33421.1 aminoacyl-tRNA hydrolase [Candidatus Moranbacteria bacterium]
MKIIIGLGNHGKKYLGTRHNIGFEFLDNFKEELAFPEFEFNKKFNAEISAKEKVILVKPQTFMNLSGEALRKILDFYKLSADDILVIHDDKDIALGEYRLAEDSSSAGHNGVQNIIDNLGTQKFKRIRIGIGTNTNLPAEDFVLQKFSDKEKEKIEKVLKEIKKFLSKIFK